MTVTIVGLGPGDPSHLTNAARDALASAPHVVVRTRHHPVIASVDPSGRFESCDDLYGSGQSFDAVYGAICERVLERAQAGGVAYAVPGHPLIAERSVEMLLTMAADRNVDTHLIAGLSFVDVAATALRRDLERVQLCDALDLRVDTQRPALIAQLYDRDTVSGLKLDLLDLYPGDHEVTLLVNLGTNREQVERIPLHELDRRAYGYLDSLFVPPLLAEADVRRFDGLFHVVARLNAPDGCPWDREQTHASLRKHLLEEAYEALDAIDRGDRDELVEELGDVLLQALMHAEVGRREGTFAMGDITEHISRKLIRRHPHVFGDATADNAAEVWQSWEQLKKQEKPDRSVLAGVPATLPALAAAQAIQGRARRVGFDWPDIEGPLGKLREEIGEFARAEGTENRVDEFGDILFVLSNIGQRLEIDAEQALRAANDKFRRRFAIVERMATEQDLDLQSMTLAEIDGMWDKAKAELRDAL